MKVPSINALVSDYNQRQRKRRDKRKDNLLFAKFIRNGMENRRKRISEDGLFEDRHGGKVVARGVAQGIMDSENWGISK